MEENKKKKVKEESEFVIFKYNFLVLFFTMCTVFVLHMLLLKNFKEWHSFNLKLVILCMGGAKVCVTHDSFNFGKLYIWLIS